MNRGVLKGQEVEIVRAASGRSYAERPRTPCSHAYEIRTEIGDISGRPYTAWNVPFGLIIRNGKNNPAVAICLECAAEMLQELRED